MDVVIGRDVSDVRTMKSMYDNDCVDVMVGDSVFRLHVDEIKKMLKNHQFIVEKKRKHSYLHLPE